MAVAKYAQNHNKENHLVDRAERSSVNIIDRLVSHEVRPVGPLELILTRTATHCRVSYKLLQIREEVGVLYRKQTKTSDLNPKPGHSGAQSSLHEPCK